MPPPLGQMLDDAGDDRSRSRVETTTRPPATPSHRQSKDKQLSHNEWIISDSECEPHLNGANNEYNGDIPAMNPRIIEGMAHRPLSHSQVVKQGPVDLEQQMPNFYDAMRFGKRRHDSHEIEAMRPAKRGRKPKAETEITNYEKDMFGLFERYKSKANDLEFSRSENQRLQIRVKALESELKRAQQAHKQDEITYSQKITQLREDAQKWKYELTTTLEAAKKDSSNYVKVSDSDIKSAWMVLSYNIRDLTKQYLTEKPSDEVTALESLVMDHLLFSPNDIADLRSHTFRRAVWNILINAVFYGKHPVWHGDTGGALTELLSVKKYDHMNNPQYLKVISQTKLVAVALLNDKFCFNMTAIDALADNVTTHLAPFLPDSKEKREEFKVGLKRLITAAVELHSMMMKSKAIFSVQWFGDDDGKKFSPFDQTQMASVYCEDDFDMSNFFVKFVEAPGLMKIGNADGENFNTSMVLCKSSVVLQEDEVDIDKKIEENGEGKIPRAYPPHTKGSFEVESVKKAMSC